MKVSHDSIFAARLLDLYRKQLFESVSLFGLNVDNAYCITRFTVFNRSSFSTDSFVWPLFLHLSQWATYCNNVLTWF